MNSNSPPQTKHHRRNLSQALEKIRDYRRIFGRRGLWLAVRTKLTRTQRTEPAPLPQNRTVAIRLNGTDLATFTKIFLHREYDIPLAREPKVIIDAGANVGYASAFFAIQYPNAKIIAIEPETANFALLQQNTACFPNVSPVQAALWPTSGHVNLVDPGNGSWGFETTDPDTPLESTSLGQVRAVTVSEIMTEFNLDYVDLLKVDIEGGEKAVFTDSPEWLKRVGAVMIELHDRLRIGCTRNFYIATRDFSTEIQKGENIIMLRPDYVKA